MSKSYKKKTFSKQRNSKWAKKLANRKFRRFKTDADNGKFYKKVFCSYDICDYSFYMPWNEKNWMTKDQWERWVIRK